MPKISEERRAQRQAQILDAAWRCFHRDGVQGTTMEQIIAASGLSASAMYRYFAGKDDIIVAAMGQSLGSLAAKLQPLLDAPERVGVGALIGAITGAIDRFSNRPGYRLTTIALHGWSEAQRNPRVRKLVRESYGAFRERLTERVRRWQDEGEIGEEESAQDVAQAILSLILGYVAQVALLGDAMPMAHERGVAAIGRSKIAVRRRRIG